MVSNNSAPLLKPHQSRRQSSCRGRTARSRESRSPSWRPGKRHSPVRWSNGLFLSYYERGEDGEIPEAQVFRLEGPAAVLYFRGYPHVHAFINVAMDAEAPLSSGELLGHNPTWLDRAGVKSLFEAAMRAETGVDRGYYPDESVAGRLRPGAIRSGDIFTLESWQDEVHVGELRGSRVATTSYGLTQLRERGDRVETARSRGMLRDLAVTYVKRHGLTAFSTDVGRS
jgi:hypothetical protein